MNNAFHPQKVHCGILRYPISDCWSKLPQLKEVLERKLKEAKSRGCVSISHFRRNDGRELLYHIPFLDPSFNYDVVDGLSRFVSGARNDWREWLHDYDLFPHLNRKLQATWQQSVENRILFSFVIKLDKHGRRIFFQIDELTQESDSEPHHVTIDYWIGPKNLLSESEWLEATRVYDLAKSAGLACLQQCGINTNASLDNKPSPSGLVKESDSLRFLSGKNCKTVFERCVDALSAAIGPAGETEFSFSFFHGVPREVEHSVACLAKVPPMWSYWQTHYSVKRGFDVFALPSDHSIIRAYPLFDYFCADDNFYINLVHVRGESFIEVQACNNNKKWFDVVSDFFQAPIDVWEGPIESRFGWYGDAGDGRIVRHQVDPNFESLRTPIPPEKSAYFVFPKVMFDGFANREAQGYYLDPLELFRTRQEAEQFAQSNTQKFMELWELCMFTSQTEGFDFTDLPLENQRRAREIIGFSEQDNWRDVLDRFQWDVLSEPEFAELCKQLQVVPYRILEIEMDDEALFKKLSKRIKSGKFDTALRQQLCELLGLTIMEHTFPK